MLNAVVAELGILIVQLMFIYRSIVLISLIRYINRSAYVYIYIYIYIYSITQLYIVLPNKWTNANPAF